MLTQTNNQTSNFPSTPIKHDQLAFFAKKNWGHEEWIINNPAYCGKKLVFYSGHQCSMHHHKIKHETFYILTGKVYLETDTNGAIEKRIMTPGDIAIIQPLTWHQLTALENSEVMEFSTFHMEEDSYRRTGSGKADLAAMGLSSL
jgi:quercetin dioxygenase-like cupin family protein